MRGRAIVLALAVCATPAIGAEAGAFCTMLAEHRSFDADASPVEVPDLGEATCSWSLGLGGIRALSCHWPFAYRAEQARVAFERLADDVAACPGMAAMPEEGGVNHPDSYDLRRFSRDGAIVAVSLKDKAALRETYIFLRLQTGGG